MNRTIEILATWFYLGRLPKAPGTWGTLGAVPLVLLLARAGAISYLILALVVVLVAVFVAQAYESKSDEHDASEIVIDEVAGYVVAAAWLPLTWQTLVGSFVLFRLLDAFKPPPINWIDQRIKGGVGVVADDLVAGMITNVILQVIFTQTNWLGLQLSTVAPPLGIGN